MNWNMYDKGFWYLSDGFFGEVLKFEQPFGLSDQDPAGKGPPRPPKERKKISASPIHLSDKIQGFKSIAIDTTPSPP